MQETMFKCLNYKRPEVNAMEMEGRLIYFAYLIFFYIFILASIISYFIFGLGFEFYLNIAGILFVYTSIQLLFLNVPLLLGRLLSLVFFIGVITVLYLKMGGLMGVALLPSAVLPAMYSFGTKDKKEHIMVAVINTVHVLFMYVFWHEFIAKPGEIEQYGKMVTVSSLAAIFISIGVQMRFVSVRNLLVEEKQKADNSSRAMSTFLANMSHEIRTPLNGIIGAIESFENTTAEEKEELFNILKSSGKNLMKIVNDIIDVSKIESGKMMLYEEVFNLRSFVKNVVEMHAYVAHKKKDLELRYQVSESLPELIQFDKGKLKQILDNLIHNAIKFTELGAVSLEVSEVGNKIQFKLTDTGEGIHPDDLQRLFTDGAEVNALDEYKKGAGLGLKIVHGIVEILEGTIHVDSDRGFGTNFTLQFPIKEIDIVEEETLVQKKMTASTKNAVIVDDDPLSLKIGTKLLSQCGLNVHPFISSKEALLFVISNHQSLDYVFLDMQMPDYDGFELTELIRTHELKNSLDPILLIALTANSMIEDKNKGLKIGLDFFVTKPYTKSDIQNIISETQTEVSNTNPAQAS